jgi:hypothetical protein
VLCAAPDVPGCRRAVRLSARCLGRRRVRVELGGELEGIYGVRFRVGRKTLRDATAPFGRTFTRVRARRVRALVSTSSEPLSLQRTAPRCARQRGA